MEQIELPDDLAVAGHTATSYCRLLTALGFGGERNGMRINFDRGLAVEIHETFLGCEVRGFRL